MTSKEFDTLYRKNFTALFRLAFQMLRDEEESRDVVNDVFANLLENPPKETINNIDGYLFRTVRNKTLDIISHQDVVQRARHLYPIEMEAYKGYDYEHDRRLQQVSEFIDKSLSPSAREAMTLVFKDGLSYKDTASRLGVSVAMINKHVVKSLRLLRDRFKKDSNE